VSDPTTFNPADKHADLTLSGGNMTVVNTYELGGWGRMVRCVDFQDSYKFYVEFEVDAMATSTAYESGNCVGFANANASLNYGPGHSADGVGFYRLGHQLMLLEMCCSLPLILTQVMSGLGSMTHGWETLLLALVPLSQGGQGRT